MPLLDDVEPVVLPDVPLIVPALPVVPVPVEPVVPPGVDVELLLVSGVVVLPLVEPVPVAPIDDVLPGVALPVVEPVLLVLPVVVLGDVELAAPLRLPLPVPLLPVVVDGVVEEELDAPVPDVPASLRWHAPRERAAATARTAVAVWVNVVFMRNSLNWVGVQKGKGSPDCPGPTLGG